MPELVLAGCRPVPLAHYLKALGVLRLVADRADPHARGSWTDAGFVLATTLDPEALVAFFLERYRPTPIVGPWNGGSGFYPKDNRAALDRIAASTSERWAEYRHTIAIAQAVVASLGTDAKVDKADKPSLLLRLRSQLPDAALDWLDAALLLTTKGPEYPPLLGTGGNDGRLDFTNNFMQRLVELLPPGAAPSAEAAPLLRNALFAEPVDRLGTNKAIGQFLPGDAGGANAEAGFDADSLINPWDFVLMLEGAVMFAAVAAKRLEHSAPGVLAYPFTVQAVGAGYGSATARDAKLSRAEMWLPLWTRPAGPAELRAVLGEGRAHVGRRSRAPRDGVDFARAVASLGVDRGIDAFERYGFQVRNGLAYFAVPLGRFEVGSSLDPLSEIDGWFDRFRRQANQDLAPARIQRALHRLERAIVHACRYERSEHRLTEVFLALGACERAMAESLAWSSHSGAGPIPRLEPDRWLGGIHRSVELRIAAAITSLGWGKPKRDPKVDSTMRSLPPIRSFIEPVEGVGARLQWRSALGPDDVGIGSVPERSLLALLQRRVLWSRSHGSKSYRESSAHVAALSDVAAFVEGGDDDHLGECLWACTLIDWPMASKDIRSQLRRDAPRGPWPGPAYALLKLCFAGRSVPVPTSTDRLAHAIPTIEVPTQPAILRLLEAGRGYDAIDTARRRLRGSELVSPLGAFDLDPAMARRLGAALLVPISKRDLGRLARSVTKPQDLPDFDREPGPEETHA